MKVFIVLSAVLALSAAKPTFVQTPIAYTAPITYTAPVVPVEVSSQYHSQDSLGQYSYGYTGGLSSKAEARSADGITRGSYSYVDPEGKVQSVQYTADDVNGFRVAATNLPVAPALPAVRTVEEPKPVQDTPEVAQAKVEHFAAVEEAKARVAAAPAEVTAEVPTQVVSYSSPLVHAYGYGYPYNSYPYSSYPYSSYAYSSYPYNYNPYSAYYPYQAGFGYQFATYPGFPVSGYPFVNPVFGAQLPQLHPISPIGPVATPVAPAPPPPAPPVAPGKPIDEDTVEVKAAKQE